VVAYAVGGRGAEACEKVQENIPPAYAHAQTVSDFWEAYTQVFGEGHRCVGKDSGETAHVERWNNTLRQRLGRFVRKTLSFSKTEENHEASLKLFIHEYDIAARHEYLSWVTVKIKPLPNGDSIHDDGLCTRHPVFLAGMAADDDFLVIFSGIGYGLLTVTRKKNITGIRIANGLVERQRKRGSIECVISTILK